MTRASYAGIYSASHPGMVEGFLNLVPHLGIGGNDGKVSTLSFPADRPIVALAFSEGSAGLDVATLADGTFGLTHGEVYGYGDPARHFVRSPGRVAGEALERYRAAGTAAYARQNGNAAMVTWDARGHSLLLVRARSGIPPLYYAQRGDAILWAPDLQTLLQFGIPGDVDHEALDLLLSLSHVPAPWTMFKSIRSVPPGSVVTITNDALATRRYYRLEWRPKHSLSPDEAVSRFRELFEQAVSRRISTNGRYAVLLSGGVDSALVAAGLSRLVGSGRVEAFTVNYPSYEGVLNEGPRAWRSATQFHVTHHTVEFGPREIIQGIDRYVRQYEEPFTYGLHTAWLGDVAASGFSVVFVGAGPVSVGLRPFEHWAAEFSRLRLPRVLDISARALRRAEHVFPRVGTLRKALQLSATPLPTAYAQPRMSIDVSRRSLLSDPKQEGVGTQKAAAIYARALEEVRGESYRDQHHFLRMAFDLPDNVSRWLHQWSNAHGLVIRDPLWDDDLIAFFVRLRRNYAGKTDLRRLALSFMPAEMAFAPKVFQSVPVGVWLRGPLQELLRSTLTTDRLKRDGLFNPQTVGLIVDEHVRGGMDHGWTLWSLLAVSVWLEVMVRERPRPVPLVSAR